MVFFSEAETSAPSTFLSLKDTPASFSAGQTLRVNAGGTGLEYYTPSGGVTINDTTPSTTTTYSGTKIEQELALLVTAADAPQLPQTTTAERVVVTTGTENVFEDSLKIYREAGNTINIGEHNESNRSTREESICIGLNSGANGNATHAKTCVGYQAGRGTAGDQLVAMGVRSFESSTGQRVTSLGHYAMAQCNNGDDSVAVGNYAGQYTTILTDSVSIGKDACRNARSTGVTKSTHIGKLAGNAANTDRTIAIGYESGRNNVGNTCVFLGNTQGLNNTAHNRLLIGNDSAHAIIDGTMGANHASCILQLNADSVLLGNSIPTAYDGTKPTQIWVSDNTLRRGPYTASSGGSSTYLSLTDTPSTHSANSLLYSTGTAIAHTTSQILIDGGGVQVDQLNARVNNTSNIGDNSHKFDNVFCNAIHQGNVKLVLPTVRGSVNQILKVQSVNSEVHTLIFADDDTSGAGGSGSSTFIGLNDTPASITANQTIRGNSSGTALEFYTPAISDITNLQTSLDGKLSTQVNTLGSGGTSLHIVSGQQLGLKRLNAGSNVTITENNGDISISATGSGSTEVDDTQITSTTTYSSQKIVNDYFPYANVHGTFRSGTNEVYNAPYINTELGNKLSTSGGSLSGHVTTNQTTFTSNDQLVTKSYVDGSSAGKTLTSGTYDLGAGTIAINQQDATSITITGCPRPLSAYNAGAGSGNYYTPAFLNERIIPEVVSATNQYVLANNGTNAEWMSTITASASTLNFGTSTIKNFMTWALGYFGSYFLRATPSNGDTLGSLLFGDTGLNYYSMMSGKVDNTTGGSQQGHVSVSAAKSGTMTEQLIVGKSDHSSTDVGQFTGTVKVGGVKFSGNTTQTKPVEDPTTVGHVLTATAGGNWQWAAPSGGLSFTPSFTKSTMYGKVNRTSMITILQGQSHMFDGQMANQTGGTANVAWYFNNSAAHAINEFTIWTQDSTDGSSSDNFRNYVCEIYGSNGTDTAAPPSGGWVRLNADATVWLAESIACPSLIWSQYSQLYPQGFRFKCTTNMNNYNRYWLKFNFTLNPCYEVHWNYNKSHEVEYT